MYFYLIMQIFFLNFSNKRNSIKSLENIYSFHEILEIWMIDFFRGGGGGVVFERIEIFMRGGERCGEFFFER